MAMTIGIAPECLAKLEAEFKAEGMSEAEIAAEIKHLQAQAKEQITQMYLSGGLLDDTSFPTIH